MAGGTKALRPELSMMLDREREFFEAHREELVREHAGGFALVKGDELIGVLPSAEDAYEKGVAQFGLQPFLIAEIVPSEKISVIPWMQLSGRDKL